MKRKWVLLKITLLLAGLIFLLSFSQRQYELRDVQEVVKVINYANGNHFIPEKAVDSILRKSHPDYPHMQMKRVDPREMEYLLIQDDYISYANVYLDLNGSLYTEVHQETPVLRIKQDTEQYYISESGKKLPLSTEYSPRVLIADGDIEETEYNQLIELIKIINEDNLLKTLVIGIRKEKLNSFILLIDGGDYTLELGKLENLKSKLKNFEVFHSEYIQKTAQMPYTKINLRFNNQIVASK